MREAAAAVSVGTYSAWGKYCYVASARQRVRRYRAPMDRRGAGAYCVAMRTACYNNGFSLAKIQCNYLFIFLHFQIQHVKVVQ